MYDVILTTNYSPWSPYSGGGQKSTHMLASAYASMGMRVAVVYTKAPWEKITPPADLPYAVHWAFFFALRPGISSIFRWMNCFSVFRLVNKISSPNTTLIGSGDEAALLGYVQAKKRFIYCNRYPNPPAWLTRVLWTHWLGWLYCSLREPRFWAMAMASRTADAIACTSLDSLRQYQAAFPMGAARAQKVPNGIDPCFLQGLCKEHPGTGVLYFGRLTVGKGVRELLSAYGQLPAELRRAHPLTLVGQGPLADEIQIASAQDSQIRLVPWMNSSGLSTFINANRLVVLPSHEESFGNTMLETLAQGQDLLTCSAGSIPEVVQDQATLVPPCNAVALATTMENVLRQPFDAGLARKRRQWVQNHYAWETTARQLLHI